MKTNNTQGITGNRLGWLVLGMVVCFQAASPAAETTNILATRGKLKPAIRFGETYGEKLVSTPDEIVPGEPRTFTREVVPNAGKITATISANLATLDLPNPIDPTTPVELNTASGMPNRLAITAVDSSGNLSVLAKKILPQ